MSRQNDDIVIEAAAEKKSNAQSASGLWDKLQKPYTITLPIWVYGLAALLAAVLILD